MASLGEYTPEAVFDPGMALIKAGFYGWQGLRFEHTGDGWFIHGALPMTPAIPTSPRCPYPDCQDERAHPRPHLIEAAAIERRVAAAVATERARLRAAVERFESEREVRYGYGLTHVETQAGADAPKIMVRRDPQDEVAALLDVLALLEERP
jgi:hypothetical protein